VLSTYTLTVVNQYIICTVSISDWMCATKNTYVHEFDIITFLCVLIISHTFFYNNTVLSFLGAGRSERN